jgi:hypothetical protein
MVHIALDKMTTTAAMTRVMLLLRRKRRKKRRNLKKIGGRKWIATVMCPLNTMTPQ